MPVVANGRQVLLGLVFISVATAGAHAEIVVNGGFETGQFFPWNAPGAIFPPAPNPQYFVISNGGAHSGNHFAIMSSTQLRFISQVLPTEAGGDYELSFWLRHSSNPPPQRFSQSGGRGRRSSTTRIRSRAEHGPSSPSHSTPTSPARSSSSGR